MLETVSMTVVLLVQIYLALGALFVVPFLRRGAGRLDSSAEKGSLGFRLVIVPGVVALWPVLARKWWRAARNER